MTDLSTTILTNAHVITGGNENKIWDRAFVAFEGGSIKAIGPGQPEFLTFPGATIIDMEGKLIIPGPIDGHTHIAMAPFRGIVHDQANVLYDIVWPVETSITEEDCYHLARLGALETLKAGSTAVADHYFFMDAIAKGIEDVGIRGFVGETIMDMGGPFSSPQSLERAMDFYYKWNKRSPLITPILAPHAPDTVSTNALRLCADFALSNSVPMHMHLSQTQHEMKVMNDMYGKTPIQYMNDIGGLNPFTVAAHCIFITKEDIRILADTGIHAIYCPSTHAFTGYVSPVTAMLRAGINVGIGTDYVAENDDHSLYEEMRLATMLQKLNDHNPLALQTSDVFSMATIANAKAFHQEAHLGSLAPGKAADMVVIDLNTPRLTPHYALLSTVVYAVCETDVHSVIVNGEFVLRDRKALKVNEADVIREGQKACDRIMKHASSKSPHIKTMIGKL